MYKPKFPNQLPYRAACKILLWNPTVVRAHIIVLVCFTAAHWLEAYWTPCARIYKPSSWGHVWDLQNFKQFTKSKRQRNWLYTGTGKYSAYGGTGWSLLRYPSKEYTSCTCTDASLQGAISLLINIQALTSTGITTLALFPTQISSQYCINPIWLSAAIVSPSLFNATLYVTSVHDAGLHGQRETAESLFYKAETIRELNEALRDPVEAMRDETLCAVFLLTHVIVCAPLLAVLSSGTIRLLERWMNNVNRAS